MNLLIQRGHTVLPEGMTLSHVIELIERLARHLGLGAARCAVLLRMMRQTAPADWRDPGRDPVCFRAQQDLARDLGISSRTLRLHEKGLEALGLIRIDTAANGRRSGRHLSHGRRLGINFRPILESLERLMALDSEHRKEAHRMTVLRLECSAAKRDAKQAIERLLEIDPQHAALPGVLRRFAAWPRRYAGFPCSEDLAGHLAEIEAVLAEARICLESCTKASAMSAVVLPAIGNTIPKNLEKSETGETAGKLPAATWHSPRENAAEECEQEDLGWLTPAVVQEMAGPDFRYCLDAHCPSGVITGRDLRSTAIMLLRDLGITESAWEEALDQMGSLRASLAVLLIEAKRYHPTAPVHAPGAMLRGFAARDRRGEFNLSGALKGLLRRKRGTA